MLKEGKKSKEELLAEIKKLWSLWIFCRIKSKTIYTLKLYKIYIKTLQKFNIVKIFKQS